MKRQQASSSSGHNLPVIVIDDSTDEDTSVLISSKPPSPTTTTTARIPSQHLPIVSVSDDESADLNPSSSTTLPSSTLNFDDEEYSEYESSSSDSGFDSDEEAPNQYNIEDFLESLTREEERERLANRQQTPPPRVQYPSMASNSSNSSSSNNNSFTNTNRINIPFHPTSRNNNPFVVNNNNNTNRNLLQHHRIQSTTPTTARTPIQASRNRYTPIPTTNNRMFGLPAASQTNHPNQHLHHHFINNHHHNIGMPNHHPFQIFTDHGPPPGLHRILEQHMMAQAFERSQHHHQGGVHPLMFVNRDFDDRDYEMLLALDDNVETTTKKTAASVVGKLPIVHIEEKDCTCSICLEDLEQGSFASEIPFCNHKFHTDCIEKWLKDYGHTCPVCKQVVTEIDFKHAEKIKEENTNGNKRKGYTNKDITESKFKKKKIE